MVPAVYVLIAKDHRRAGTDSAAAAAPPAEKPTPDEGTAEEPTEANVRVTTDR